MSSWLECSIVNLYWHLHVASIFAGLRIYTSPSVFSLTFVLYAEWNSVTQTGDSTKPHVSSLCYSVTNAIDWRLELVVVHRSRNDSSGIVCGRMNSVWAPWVRDWAGNNWFHGQINSQWLSRANHIELLWIWFIWLSAELVYQQCMPIGNKNDAINGTDTVQDGCSDIQSRAWRRTTLPQFASACCRRARSTSTPLCQIEPSADSAVQTVNRRRSSVSGRSSTVLKQASWQCRVGQFVVGFSAATETHSVPAVIPRHYPATFLNCNTHNGPSSGIAT